jgi:hypothetical protein
LTSRIDFRIIGHDLEVLWKKVQGVFFWEFSKMGIFGIFWEFSKISANKCPFGVDSPFLDGESEKSDPETIC